MSDGYSSPAEELLLFEAIDGMLCRLENMKMNFL